MIVGEFLMLKSFCGLFVFLILVLPQTVAAETASEALKKIFSRDMETLDLARVKLEIDHMINPSTNIEARLFEINAMAAFVRNAAPKTATAWDKVNILRQFVYEGGHWNGGTPFTYDHDDPNGDVLSNKLLATYLDDRLGNCITMPLLFLFMAERLDLDVTAALAPEHVFVKFTDDDGRIWNLEATSGAGATRDIWYRKQLPMTDRAINNGLYLRPLSKRETVAVIASYLLEHVYAAGEYEEAIEVADVILENHPAFAFVMLKKAAALYQILARDYYSQYVNASDVPVHEHARVHSLQAQNLGIFAHAEKLGWQPLAD